MSYPSLKPVCVIPLFETVGELPCSWLREQQTGARWSRGGSSPAEVVLTPRGVMRFQRMRFEIRDDGLRASYLRIEQVDKKSPLLASAEWGAVQ